MGLIETEETNQFSFEAFAAHSFYTEVNRSLVRHALASLAKRPPNAVLTIVDMACGTGAITRLIAEEVANQGRQAYIIGVEEKHQISPISFIMQMPLSSATRFTSSPTNFPHFDSLLASLPLTAYSRVTVPFTMVPMLRELNVSTVCGPGAPLAGYAKNTRKYTYHAKQKQLPCNNLTARDIFAFSKKEDSAV